MAAIFKNVYFDVLDYIVDKYKNTYHNTIKMKPIDVKNNNFTKYNEESNEKDPKFKIGNRVRIVKKRLKRREINYISNGKDIIILLVVILIKKIL